MAISMKGYMLIREVQALHTAQIQRAEIAEQLVYWENVLAKHAGYRDAYFKASVLAYQLGEKDKAKQYLIEAMALDPNFSDGKVFGEKTGLL
jgi:tetratricopeptide (TPR) repeat protein